MKLNNFAFILLFILFGSNTPLPVSKGYFMFPIRPGERNYLSGSMGELRNNHFHGGIDIKTSGTIGLPVYASAEGYISRISMDASGYGKRIAITHPNGFVTHYGHLDHFSERIERYVINEQYKAEKYEMEITPEEGLLKVEKGEVFAFSGNTGSSAGPHLHYEIRDKSDNVYNPLDFDFDEINDTQAPRIYRMALKPVHGTSSVNGRTNKQYFRLGYFGGKYVLNETVSAFGQIGLEIKAYDRMNGTYNKYGIQEIQVWIDGERYFEQKIDYYPILITRQINLHVDYNDVFERGDWYHKCYVTEGNDLPFYKFKSNRGVIDIKDSKTHKVQVFVKDSYENVSLLEFSLDGKAPKFDLSKRDTSQAPKFDFDLQGHNLRMELENSSIDKKVDLFVAYNKKSLSPSMITSRHNIYIYDLRQGIPDSIRVMDSSYSVPYKYMIHPKKKVEYFKRNVKLKFDEYAIHDTLFLKHSFSDTLLSIHEANYPLSSYMTVDWTISNADATKAQVYRKEGKRLLFAGNSWNGNTVSFRSRSFGDFVLAHDSIAPSVRLIYNTGKEMKLRIRDDLSGIKNYDVYVDDQWVLMEYDAKYNLLTSKLRDESMRLRGKAKVIIEDNAGNIKNLELDL